MLLKLFSWQICHGGTDPGREKKRSRWTTGCVDYDNQEKMRKKIVLYCPYWGEYWTSKGNEAFNIQKCLGFLIRVERSGFIFTNWLVLCLKVGKNISRIHVVYYFCHSFGPFDRYVAILASGSSIFGILSASLGGAFLRIGQ